MILINACSMNEGCTTHNACNYNPDAFLNDGSCEFPEECYNCEGDCTCDIDCEGICGGYAILDNCDTCDNDTSNDCVKGCDEIWGSNTKLDECGVCDSDLSNDCQDCSVYFNFNQSTVCLL